MYNTHTNYKMIILLYVCVRVRMFMCVCVCVCLRVLLRLLGQEVLQGGVGEVLVDQHGGVAIQVCAPGHHGSRNRRSSLQQYEQTKT